MHMEIPIEKFGEVMAYLGTGVGKEPTEEQIDVYYDALNDLPLDALRFAAKRAMLETSYPVIPSVGTIRKLAIGFMRGGDGMTSGAAYELSRKAIRSFGYMQQVEGLASLPDEVATIVRQIGWDVWCDSDNPESTRARFAQFWDARQQQQQRAELLPQHMQQALEQQRRNRELVEKAAKAIAKPVPAIQEKPLVPRLTKQPAVEQPVPELTPEQIQARQRLREATLQHQKRIAENSGPEAADRMPNRQADRADPKAGRLTA